LNKANEFWMEILNENRDKHRKFLTALLKNDETCQDCSFIISQGIKNIKEDLVFFIVENKNWLEEYPNVLKERFFKKLDKL